MPKTLDPNNVSGSAAQERAQRMKERLEEANFNYDYPNKLKLKPATKFHDELLEKVMRRARDSQRVMSKRYGGWNDIDKVLRTYVPPEEIENKEDNGKKTKYTPTIIIPQSYATLETLLTYMTAAFLQNPIWKYEGVGPTDVLGAELMTAVVHQQAMTNKVGLALHTQWRDAFAYGIGVTSPVWQRRLGNKTTVHEQGFMDVLRDMFFVTQKGRGVEQGKLIYEGNNLMNIDPYSYLPDPNVSAHDVQSAEFTGWVEKTNLMGLLNRDKDGGDYVFNGLYVKLVDGESTLISHRTHSSGRDEGPNEAMSTNPVHILWMYIDLIPREWELGASEYPEAWLFGVAGDRVIVAAQPLNLDHGLKPITVCAPDYDGYSANPISRLGTIHDIQTIIDFLFSSHIQNVRKAVNDMFVIDPSIIDYYDATSPEPGKMIRARRSAWGKGILRDSIMQFPVSNVTQSNVGDTAFLTEIMQQVSGATDLASGRMSPRTSRVSASEVNQLSSSSLSRLEKIARIISMQSMQPTGYMFASHVQQLMEEDTYIRMFGEMEERLRSDFGLEGEHGRMAVNPLDMIVDFDVLPHDGTIPGAEDAQTWIQLFQVIMGNEILSQKFDVPRIFKHIARQMGAKNVEDFVQQQQPQQPNVQVMPDDQVDAQEQQGNLVGQNGAI